MTPKMEAFCNSYLKNGGNGRAAAQEAGYLGDCRALTRRAHLLLKENEIKEYLSGHSKEACEEMKLTVNKVLTDLEWAKENAKLGYGTLYGTRTDLTAYIKATELQGKYLKMWVDRMEVTGEGHDEIMKIIKKRLEESGA